MYQRARFYGAASRQSFERGALAELGLTCELPAYPGDGRIACKVNCGCRWSVRILSKARQGYDVSWRLGRRDEHCRHCRRRTEAWKALEVRRNQLVSGYEIDGCFP